MSQYTPEMVQEAKEMIRVIEDVQTYLAEHDKMWCMSCVKRPEVIRARGIVWVVSPGDPDCPIANEIIGTHRVPGDIPGIYRRCSCYEPSPRRTVKVEEPAPGTYCPELNCDITECGLNQKRIDEEKPRYVYAHKPKDCLKDRRERKEKHE